MSFYERFEPIGMCWLMYSEEFGGGCDWWNPTEDMICEGVKINPCIKCWEFKREDD